MMSDDLDPSLFDSEEIIRSGKYSKYGKRWNIFIEDPKQLDATVMKTDTALITIPELSLEEAPGTGRYISLGDLMKGLELQYCVTVEEIYNKLQASSGYFSGPQRARFNKMLDRMGKFVSAEESFCMVMDDPLGNSFIKWDDDIPAIRIDEEQYTRSWDQNEDLGIPQEFENIESHNNNNDVPESHSQVEYTTEEAVTQLAKLIENSWNIVALTGAGISVESGIPAFRGGEDSIWAKYDPMNNTYQNFLTSQEVRERYWQMKKEIWGIVSKAHPNPSHQIFARLQKDIKLLGIVTQNIDGLHERSGVESEKICNLHGTMSYVFCDYCMKTYNAEQVYSDVASGKTAAPTCDCGGPIRPSTVFFGEPLDPNVLERARDMISNCDLLIVMGSSLVVQPANTLPRIAFQNKIPVVIINLEETQYDKFATIVIHHPCGKTMSMVEDELSKL